MLYDSTVDDVKDPSVFVTYHDAQAYPEVITRSWWLSPDKPMLTQLRFSILLLSENFLVVIATR